MSTSVALVGGEVRPVEVQVHLGAQKDLFKLSGLPDTAVREAKDRVRAAVTSRGIRFPNRTVTVNLAGDMWMAFDAAAYGTEVFSPDGFSKVHRALEAAGFEKPKQRMGLTVREVIAGLDTHPPDAQVVVVYSTGMPLREIKGALSDENLNPLELFGQTQPLSRYSFYWWMGMRRQSPAGRVIYGEPGRWRVETQW